MTELRDRRDPRGAPLGSDLHEGVGAVRSVRVLILDEDRVEGGMLAFHLRREGLVVMLMTSVEEARDAIAWSAPDVVLVEITGRGFDGHAFITQLAEGALGGEALGPQAGTEAIGIYAVADRPLELEDELEALRLGVIEVLMKPLDPAALARRLLSRPLTARRGLMPDLPDGGISGDLAVHPATWLLQMAHRHRMNARLHVEIDGDWGVLLVRHGEIIDAEAPTATGREAAYQAIRAEGGAFVLFPLPPDAEELSRDDVVRADLATLVTDALGRQAPRAVNVAREQQRETYIMAATRGTPAKRGGEGTLEYVAQEHEPHKPVSARVKRPGERAREQRVGPRLAVGRDPSGENPAAPARAQVVARGPVRGGAGDARPLHERPPSRPSERVTIDEEDGAQAVRSSSLERAGGPPRTQYKSGDVAERRSGTDPMGRLLQVPDDESPRPRRDRGEVPRAGKLKRVGGPRTGEAPRVSREPTNPEMAAFELTPEDEAPPIAPHRATRRGGGPLTWGLALVLVVLAAFVVARLLSRSPEAPPDDAETRFGRALLALDEGRRDAARTELSALAAESTAPSGVISSLAKIEYEDGRLAEAEALLVRLAERHPRDAQVLTWLGMVQLERSNVPAARASLSRARQVAPEGPLARQLESLLGDTLAADPKSP